MALAASQTGSIPLVGDWVLNPSRTHYGEGVERRRREQFTCVAERNKLRCNINSVRADGRLVAARFSAPMSGARAPVTGMPDIDGVELRQSNRSLVDATFFWRGKPVFAYRAMRSNDGQSLMIVSVDATSRTILSTIVVYDRR
jgi:hypothetical protein